MALYTDTVMDHFMHPRNVGEIPDADGVGEVGNAKCGDIMRMYLKIKDDKIEDVKFETFGCGSAIASSSMATEMIKGKTVEEALSLTNKEVVDALDSNLEAVHLLEQEAEYLSAAIVNLTNLVRIDSVLLAGDLLYGAERIIPLIERRVNQRCLRLGGKAIQVYPSASVPGIRILAAADVAFDRLLQV